MDQLMCRVLPYTESPSGGNQYQKIQTEPTEAIVPRLVSVMFCAAAAVSQLAKHQAAILELGLNKNLENILFKHHSELIL